MGYVPGLLVIFGGCFLWGILVQNTLKGKKQLLMLKLEELKEAVAERDRLIQALFNEIPPLDLEEINSRFLIKLQSLQYAINSSFLSVESDATKWIKKIVDILTSKGYSEQALKLLSDSSLAVNSKIREYKNTVKSYNQLIESRPTSFMASFLKFEKVTV